MRNILNRRAIALAIGALLAGPAAAAPGDIDYGFNGSMRLQQKLEPQASHYPRAAVIIPRTNRTILVSRVGPSLAERLMVSSYDVTGKPDARPPVRLDGLEDVAGFSIGADGMVYLLGSPSYSSPYRDTAIAVLARFTEDGALDTSFGEAGQIPVNVPIPDRNVLVSQFIALPDGSFLAAGNAVTRDFPSVYSNWVGRLQVAGSAVTVTPLVIPPRQDESHLDFYNGYVRSMRLQADGRVVLTADGDFGPGRLTFGSIIMRFDPVAGRFDPTFGRLGRVERVGERVEDLSVMLDDRVVALAASVSATDTVTTTSLSLWTRDGQPVTSFGDGGTVKRPLSEGIATFRHLAAPFDTAIHIVGITSRGDRKAKATTTIERYTATGALDAAFGANGRTYVDQTTSDDFVGAVAQYAGGTRQILIANGGGPNVLAMTRISTDESPLTAMTSVSSPSYDNRLAAGGMMTAFYPTMRLPSACPGKTFLECEYLKVTVTWPDATAILGGTSRVVKPLYMSSNQMNLVLPAEIPPGATVSIAVEDTWDHRVVARDTTYVDGVAPGVFTVNASGTGTPSGQFVRVVAGRQEWGTISADPIPLSDADEVQLVLYGTGWRNATETRVMMRPLDGARPGAFPIPAEITYAGPQPTYAGLDQLNVRIPAAAMRERGWSGKHLIWIDAQSGDTRGGYVRSNPVEVDITP